MPFRTTRRGDADNAPGGTYLLWSSNLFMRSKQTRYDKWSAAREYSERDVETTSEAEGSRVSARLLLVVSSTLPGDERGRGEARKREREKVRFDQSRHTANELEQFEGTRQQYAEALIGREGDELCMAGEGRHTTVMGTFAVPLA
jgi:hypothetical protein